jgi:FkbM family methyltransferase
VFSVDYRELKAKDQENDKLQRRHPSKTLAERLENLPQKIRAKLNNLPRRALNRLRYLLDLNLLRIKPKLELIRRVDYPRNDIYMKVNSLSEYKRIFPCHKEPWTVEWLENSIQPNEVMFDVGANVGGYSLIAAKLMGGQVKIFAFEPSFSTYSSLCHNIVLNHCQDIIIPFQIALSDQTGLANFNYSNLDSGTALHCLGEPIHFMGRKFTSVYQQPIISYRLDDLIANFNLPIPNHIKLDVDGPELKVLYGAQQTLADPRMQSLIIELNEDKSLSDEKIVDFLEAKGFCLKTRNIRVSIQGERRPYSFCVFWRCQSS